VVPDLPSVRKDGPGGSGTPHRGRFARLCAVVWRLRSFSSGLQAASAAALAARRFRARLSISVLAVTAASALTVGLLAPAASADSLTDQRDQVAQRLARTKSQLNESSNALSAAGVAVDQAQSRLESARAQLAQTQAEAAAAHERDVALAAKLRQAKKDLAAARAAVVAGQKAVDAKIAMAGDIVRDQYQQQTNLLPIALLVENSSTSDLQTRLQWSTTMFDTTDAAIDDLKALQRKLEAQKARQAELEAQVAADRQEAADNLKVKQSLRARAAAEEADVTALVRERRAVEAAAADDVAQDRAQYAKLSQERASVEQRIAARVAKAKAEAAARKAAEQRARQAAARHAAARASAEARRAKQSAKKPVLRRSAPAAPSAPARVRWVPRADSSASTSSVAHGFSYPVSAPITSPFGMRFHPVLHYWKLHDGTDFGAGCGTAIRAPYPGRVAERYYNAGYGNRLMIDHGNVDGRYVTTGYNHAIRYTVSVGQHVSKGQVIGYVGTTGFSTGCHLHLMIWLNGGLINPMTWY
jgi:murein DD-endopeptidase MepM/ murein hydrolase activator NlpD